MQGLQDTHLQLLSWIGKTPLLRLSAVARGIVRERVRLFAKAEWFNPGGSVKDRPALNIIRQAIASGQLTKEKILIDATSGNTGIAYAMIGAALGYRVQLALPENASIERKRILEAFGAELIFTSRLEGTDGAQHAVKEVIARSPEKYFYADQYNNPCNWEAHYHSTGLEIYQQTQNAVTHFVAGLGTTGTFIGTSRRLKELDQRIRCISFQPDSPLHGLEGLKHLETALVPGIYDNTIADENIAIESGEAYEMVKKLAREEGLLVGPSSGAAMVAMLNVAKQLDEGTIVTVFPDNGTKYLNDQR